MARSITIEGSITPSTFLARGERTRVQLTDDVQALLDGGFVVEVDRETDEPVDPPKLPEPPKPPSRSASREDWAEFLAAGEFGIVTEGKDRTALLAEWDAYTASRT